MPQENEARQAPRQPRSLSDWRAVKQSAISQAMSASGDTIGLAEQGLSKFVDVHDAVQPIDRRDNRILLDIMLLGTHRILFNGLDLLAERQGFEAMAVIRPAVEMAADATKIGRDPALAEVWLRRDEDEGAFQNAFTRRRFPPGDPLSGPLYRTYEITCEFGSHSNANIVLMHSTFTEKSGGDVAYFLRDDAMMRRLLVHFVVTTKRILDVYVESLAPIARRDLNEIVSIWNSAIDIHRGSHRDLFRRSEEGGAQATTS